MITALIICTGLMAGIYATFSLIIMRSLATLGPLTSATVMNTINREILKTLFLPIFFGSTVLFALAIAQALFSHYDGNVALLIIAAVVYWLGMFAVTVIGNVPMNNRLNQLATNERQLKLYWTHYVIRWTQLNHVRTAACLVSLFALCYV